MSCVNNSANVANANSESASTDSASFNIYDEIHSMVDSIQSLSNKALDLTEMSIILKQLKDIYARNSESASTTESTDDDSNAIHFECNTDYPIPDASQYTYRVGNETNLYGDVIDNATGEVVPINFYHNSGHPMVHIYVDSAEKAKDVGIYNVTCATYYQRPFTDNKNKLKTDHLNQNSFDDNITNLQQKTSAGNANNTHKNYAVISTTDIPSSVERIIMKYSFRSGIVKSATVVYDNLISKSDRLYIDRTTKVVYVRMDSSTAYAYCPYRCNRDNKDYYVISQQLLGGKYNNIIFTYDDIMFDGIDDEPDEYDIFAEL